MRAGMKWPPTGVYAPDLSKSTRSDDDCLTF
jgi:hypothetical protein